MISLFIVAAIALSVAIGYKTKYNTGFFCNSICICNRLLCYDDETEGSNQRVASEYDVCYYGCVIVL